MRPLVYLTFLVLLRNSLGCPLLFFRFAKICRHYRYTNGCTQALEEETCTPVKLTFNEPRCPIYVACKVKIVCYLQL